MSPYTLLGYLLLATIVAAVLPYIIGKWSLARKERRRVTEWQSFGRLNDEPESAALAAARERFRDGGTMGFNPNPGPQAALFEGVKSSGTRYHEQFVKNAPSRAAAFGQRKPSIFLTPRQLERVNIQRKLRGQDPLNRRGFTNAVAHAWDQPVRQPANSNEWLTYLILYECLFPDHASNRVYVDTGLTITPDAPYNGHGGEFAGAGSSGSWTSPDASTASAAAAITTGAAIFAGDTSSSGATGYTPGDPLSDPDSYKGGDRPVEPATAGDGYHYADPVPSNPYDSPRSDPSPSGDYGTGSSPAPSYTPDPSPSPSFDSSPAPSFDSGSSSSGGDGS